jgi:hypothetical protein
MLRSVLAVVVLLAGPAFLSGPGTARLLALDSDIKEVQQRWRRYRSIVMDGVVINDSMIVSEYSEDEDLRNQIESYKHLSMSLSENHKHHHTTESPEDEHSSLERNGLEKVRMAVAAL